MQTQLIEKIKKGRQLFADLFSRLLENTDPFTEIRSFPNTKELFPHLLRNMDNKAHCPLIQTNVTLNNDRIGFSP